MPLSNYQVGVAVKGMSGRVYLGTNFEHPHSQGATVHGEQSAVHNAAIHGERGLIKLAVNAPPCGHCRQFLLELGADHTLEVIIGLGDSLVVQVQPSCM